MGVTDFPTSSRTQILPKRHDIFIYQGDTLKIPFALEDKEGHPINLTGWTGMAKLKKVSDNSPAETPNIAVEIVGLTGVVILYISSEGTEALSGTTEYKYDVQLDDGENIRTFIGGKLTVTEDVTE